MDRNRPRQAKAPFTVEPPRRREGTVAAKRASPTSITPQHAAILNLQRSAGNRAVGALLATRPVPRSRANHEVVRSGGSHDRDSRPLGPTVQRDDWASDAPTEYGDQEWVTTEEYTGLREKQKPKPPPPEITPEKAAAIEDGKLMAETRARSFLNTNHSEVQDAARDFASSAQAQIETLTDPPSGYISLVKPITNGVMNAVGAYYPASDRLNILTNVGSGAISQVHDSAASHRSGADADTYVSAQATVTRGAEASVNGVAAMFSTYRGQFRDLLNEHAAADTKVQDLLANRDPRSLDQVILTALGLPDPDKKAFYPLLRTQMELPFEAWMEFQRAKSATRWAQMGEVTRQGRESVEARVREATERRSGKASPMNEGMRSFLESAANVLYGGGRNLPPELAEAIAPPKEPSEGPTLDPTEDPVEQAVRRGMTLADTRARENLNAIYNDVQDALRDGVATMDSDIDALPGAPSGHWGLVSTILDAVQKGSTTFFPQLRIGQNIKIALLTGLGATLQGAASTHVANSRDAAKADTRNALNSLASEVASRQSGIYGNARQEIFPALVGMAAEDEAVRTLLAGGTTEGVNAVTAMLGIPDPGRLFVYREVRQKMEIPFQDWMQKQHRTAQGWTWMGGIATDTERVRTRIERDSMRRGEGVSSHESGGMPWWDPIEEIPETAPGIDLVAEDEAARDERILNNVALVEDRAKGYLNVYRDATQDAVQHFADSSAAQVGAITDDFADWLTLGLNIGLTTLSVLSVICGPATIAGAIILTAYVSGSMAGQVKATVRADNLARLKGDAKAKAHLIGLDLSGVLASRFVDIHNGLPSGIMTLAFDEDAPWVAKALESGDAHALEDIITNDVGLPDPDTADVYGRVRRKLEVDFAGWLAERRGGSPEEVADARSKAQEKATAAAGARD